MSRYHDITQILDPNEYLQWEAFRGASVSRYVGLCLPRVLELIPTGPDDGKTSDDRLGGTATGQDRYVWGNPAFLLASCLVRAHVDRGWCGSFVGVERGGYLADVPVARLVGRSGERLIIGPCEIRIGGDLESQLMRLGFVAAVHYQETDAVVFQSAASCNAVDPSAPPSESWPQAQLPYVLTVSRFAHYLKAILCVKRGSGIDRLEVQSFLQSWIARYVIPNGEDSTTSHAGFPLLSASLEVEDNPARPGGYKVTAELVPNVVGARPGLLMRLVIA